MRLLSYDGGVGVLEGDLVRPARGFDSVLGLLDAEGAYFDEPLPLSDVTLGVPVPRPEKIICIGLNYRSHAEEAGLEPPAVPTFFAKFANALVPDGSTVTLPTDKCDYEAEVAFVIGTDGGIAGYTLLNDVSARDRQFATPQWLPGKVFDGSAPCGPALVTPDEAGPADAIEIALTVNGEERQRATTADLIHPIPDLLEHLSTLMTLAPGDIVATGTPAGVGAVRRSYLQPGDEVVISSPQLGQLRTTFA